MKKMLLALTMAAVLFTGCATAPITTGGTLSVGSSARKVSTDVSNVNILMVFTPMSIEKVEKATSDLIAKCSGKNVTNVTSQTKVMYLYLVSLETLMLSGHCAD
jgi:outer membrane lipoprotein SlyB